MGRTARGKLLMLMAMGVGEVMVEGILSWSLSVSDLTPAAHWVS